jgi:uncharacterized membrane protein HdeD (DUF308 family)
MTSTTHAEPSPSRSSGLQSLRAKWGWIVALGVVYVLVGLVALGSVVAATVASVLVVGIMMVVAGIAGASWISIGLDLRARARR